MKQEAILDPTPKTVNIQGYSALWEPIKLHENCYPLIWWILKDSIQHTIKSIKLKLTQLAS